MKQTKTDVELLNICRHAAAIHAEAERDHSAALELVQDAAKKVRETSERLLAAQEELHKALRPAPCPSLGLIKFADGTVVGLS